MPLPVRRGLTLVELVVVCAILAVLAGMVLPMVAYVRLQGDYAAGATNAASLARLIRSAYASTNRYGNFDLLVDGSGALLPTLYAAEGAPLVAMSVPPTYTGSFASAGLDAFYTTTGTGAASAYTTSTTVGLSSGTLSTAFAVLTAPSANANAQAIVNALYPTATGSSTIPTGTMLIAMGIGPMCSLVGPVLPSAPRDTQGTDDPTSIYCYYMAIFAIYDSSSGTAPRPARLVTVVDHRFNTADANLTNFKNAVPF